MFKHICKMKNAEQQLGTWEIYALSTHTMRKKYFHKPCLHIFLIQHVLQQIIAFAIFNITIYLNCMYTHPVPVDFFILGEKKQHNI